MEFDKDKTESLKQSEGDTNNDNKKEEISTEEKKETKDTVEISPKENDDNKETASKDKEDNSTETVKDVDKKSDEGTNLKNEDTGKLEKENSSTSLSTKSSKSSLVIPKSILRKRKTDDDDDNSENMTDDVSISSIKKKHIEFSDDNIVYTLEREEDYEEDVDDEAYRHQNYIKKSLINSIFVLLKRYLLFALVISAGFCFSYYSYNKNKKSYGGRQKTGGTIIARNDQRPLSFNWEKTTTRTTETKKLTPIRSLTLSDVFTAEIPTSVEETTENVDSEKSNKESKDEPVSKNSESSNKDSESSNKDSESLNKDSESSNKDSESTEKESKSSKKEPESSKKKSKTSKKKSKKSKREEKKYKRVVAIGDVHGDFKKLVSVLLAAKIVDDSTNWIARDTILIQTGDLLDRGPDTIPIFDLLIKLRTQAQANDSILYMLLGNHEVMNLQEDLRYVVRGDVLSFGGLENRRQELSMAGRYGRLLRQEMNSTMIIDDTLFVHAGLTYAYARAGIDQINNYVHYLLQNYPAEQLFYATIFGNDGPFWLRSFALDPEDYICREVELVLQMLQVKRMVVGHTVQENGKINTRCNNQLVLIDVGLSQAYGGNFAYLEIFNDENEVWAVYRNNVRERIN